MAKLAGGGGIQAGAAVGQAGGALLLDQWPTADGLESGAELRQAVAGGGGMDGEGGAPIGGYRRVEESAAQSIRVEVLSGPEGGLGCSGQKETQADNGPSAAEYSLQGVQDALRDVVAVGDSDHGRRDGGLCIVRSGRRVLLPADRSGVPAVLRDQHSGPDVSGQCVALRVEHEPVCVLHCDENFDAAAAGRSPAYGGGGGTPVRAVELSAAAVQSVRPETDWLPYIDDYLATVRGATEAKRTERAEAAKQHAEESLDFLGLRKHAEKGQWVPKPTIDHLGIHVDSTTGQFLATKVTMARIRREAGVLIARAKSNRRLVNSTSVRSFAGLVQSKYLAIAPAQLYLRSLFDDLSKDDWSASTRLSRQSLRDLQMWRDQSASWNGSPISKAPVTRLLYSDASEFALGGNLVEGDLSRVVPERPGLAVPGPRWHRALTLVEQQQGIFVGEIRALVENVENFLPQLRGQVVQLMEDNQAAMYATRRLVSKHPVALRLLRRLWVLLGANRIRLQAVDWVASADNPADAPSRWRFSDEWKLQPAVFRWANREFGPHSLDLFASRNTAQLPRYVTRFPDSKAVTCNAWAHSWVAETSWINPSWDELERVAQRLEQEPAAAATVVCPYFPVQAWFRRLAAMAERIVVVPFNQAWVLRPQQRLSEQLGPARWNLAFMAIPARRPGCTAAASCHAPVRWVPPFDVEQLIATDLSERRG